MDFSFSADQEALRDLARQILTARCTNEHLKTVATTYPDATDSELWTQLAQAGLVGIAMPEADGGGGLGLLEACVVASECARAAAPVPMLGVLLAGLALSEYGTPADLDGVAAGDRIVTVALHEQVGDPRQPSTAVTGGSISGEKIAVLNGVSATSFVVTAADGLYLVAADAPGVTVDRQDTNSGIPQARVTFSATPARKLAGPEGNEWLQQRAATMASVMTAAACESVLTLTAEYTKGRVQFERPIASFQAVSQRAADAYIDTEAIRLTAWQAAWRLDTGKPAAEEVATAKFWASDGGHRVIHAAHHLHGGMGVDRDYPLHRYNFAVKQWDLLLGSATPSLEHLGKLLSA